MRRRGLNGFLLMSVMLALASFGAVCVTSGGITTVSSDTVEITRDAVVEVVGDVARVNVTTSNITRLSVNSELRNAERINYFVAPSGGRPASKVTINALVRPDLRERASAVIEIEAPPGVSFAVQTGIGDVTFFGVRTGTITASTTNGRIKVTGTAGSYDLETLNGQILGVGLEGPIRAKTRNGSINVTGRLPAGSVSTMETRNGDVNVTVPVASDLRVDGVVQVGRIEAPEFATIDKTGKVVEGVMGSGTASLEMRLKNGTIRLKTDG